MRLILVFLLFVASCRSPRSAAALSPGIPAGDAPAPTTSAATQPAAAQLKSSIVRVNSTQQSWNPWQPWEKNAPRRCRALAAIVGPREVLTTAEIVADASYLELESADGNHFAPAQVIAVDYEADLALLGPATQAAGDALFAGTTPLPIASAPTIGTTLQILQLEENGQTLQTDGFLQRVDLSSHFLPDQNFLTYKVKASMQSAAGSYSLPVLRDGRLAGVLMSYNAKEQICEVAATDLLESFLRAARRWPYIRFPHLGVSVARCDDPAFRQWLRLTDSQGGIYIQKVRKNSAAEKAGVRAGDVLLGIDGHAIDRRGYYEHPHYGSILWGHLIRGGKAQGDPARLSVARAGEMLEITATLQREDEPLVPLHLSNQAPRYLVKGGLVFQELSRPILEAFGEDWPVRAPLHLLDTYENPEKYQGVMDRVVFLSGVIPTPATVGYDGLRSLIVHKVNGKAVRNMGDLVKALDGKSGTIHTVEFADENLTIALDEDLSDSVDLQLRERGIQQLSRTD